ncbi:MAG: hypothetical protein ABI047_05190 [Jatrophihabitantaceae bacterium]
MNSTVWQSSFPVATGGMGLLPRGLWWQDASVVIAGRSAEGAWLGRPAAHRPAGVSSAADLDA